MPNLPTLTVTDDQATRILAVFHDAPTYRRWLRDRVVETVLRAERTVLEGEAAAETTAALEALVAALPTDADADASTA